MRTKATSDWGDDSYVTSFFEVPDAVHTVDRKASPVHVGQVRQAALIVDQAGVVDDLARYWAEDGRDATKGGRPATISERQVLIMMQLLIVEGSPYQIQRACDLVVHRMTEGALAELGLVRDTNDPQVWYSRIYRAFRRVLAPLDPHKDEQRHYRYTKQEWELLVALRDPNLINRHVLRLHHVMNRLVWASVMATPVKYRDCWDGTIAFDGTSFVASWKGTAKGAKKVSGEPNAAWYVREGDHDGKDGKNAFFWGWEAILVTMASPGESNAFPKLILGIALGQPAVRPSAQFWMAMENLTVNTVPRGYAAADRQFLPGAVPEALQIPLRRMGYRPAMDLRADGTGQQATHDGAILVDGNWYCPAMPPILITIKDDLDNGRIDLKTFNERLLRRLHFLLREKDRRADGATRYKCPAIGPGATCDCPLRQLAQESSAASGRTTVIEPPAEPRGICKQQAITIPVYVGAKYAQLAPAWNTSEWHDVYNHPRQTIESRNKIFKKVVGWEDHSRRPIRGYAAQALGAALAIVATNLVIAKAFIEKGDSLEVIPDLPERTRRRSGRWVDPARWLEDNPANAPGEAA